MQCAVRHRTRFQWNICHSSPIACPVQRHRKSTQHKRINMTHDDCKGSYLPHRDSSQTTETSTQVHQMQWAPERSLSACSSLQHTHAWSYTQVANKILPKSLSTVSVGLARMGPLGAEWVLWICDGVDVLKKNTVTWSEELHTSSPCTSALSLLRADQILCFQFQKHSVRKYKYLITKRLLLSL